MDIRLKLKVGFKFWFFLEQDSGHKHNQNCYQEVANFPGGETNLNPVTKLIFEILSWALMIQLVREFQGSVFVLLLFECEFLVQKAGFVVSVQVVEVCHGNFDMCWVEVTLVAVLADVVRHS